MKQAFIPDAPVSEMTKATNKKKIIVIWVAVIAGLLVLSIVGLSVFYFGFCSYPEKTDTYESIDDLIKEYNVDTEGNYVTNIPKSDYLKNVKMNSSISVSKLSENGVSESNTAEQNQMAINSLIDEISANGGIISVDGNYKTSTVLLKSNVTIRLEENCSLISMTYSENAASVSPLGSGLIVANNADNIAVIGPGKLEGKGTTYTYEPDKNTPLTPANKFNLKQRVLAARERLREARSGNRANLLYINNCSNVKIESVEFFEAATWTCKIIDSNNIKINNCVINNHIHVANADGFDIVSSQNVDIQHCFIATADDGIVIKANGNEEVKNITINRCSILSMANCFKIGTETSKNVTNVKCTNCYFFMAGLVGGYSGIAIESCDGSNVNDVYVDNIEMDGVSSPLLIWLGNRLDKSKGSDGKTMGSMNNINISNIEAEDVEMASAITGCINKNKTYYVTDVVLANFDVEYRESGENLNTTTVDFEKGMNDYPEICRVLSQYILSHENSLYYDMPVYGLLCRHVDGIKIYDYEVESRKCSSLPKDNITNKKDRYDTLNVFIAW